MALSPADLAKILGAGAPVLMLDTCSLLDIVREPMRHDCRLGNVKAAMAMLAAAETGSRLTVLIAEQVSLELNDNLADVLQVAGKAMREYITQANHIDRVAMEYGAAGATSTTHLVDHVARATAVLSRWVAVGISVPAGPAVAQKAMDRVRHGVAPARRGKENSKDCFVIESYLETAAQLNAAGFAGRMVFGSSNTNEYLDPVSRQPPAPLDAHLLAERVVYGSTHELMKKALGL
ncbi:PIN domain-containing protein [Roseateles sp. LYH14W]|uniref:PIN domain-containing protein n=1 Tax=Pelomonas parva TaxID=3299032 RepID=A0ABW7FAQ9_9BURK